MSQAEELLNEISTGSAEHEHTVVDSDSYFVIDPSTREIKSTARKKNVLFVGDHNSEVYTFEVPRYVEGHDMKLCTSVKVHYDNVDGETGDENSSVVDLYDLRINPANPETVICSWTIKRQVIHYVGVLSFALQYLCADNEGNVTYEWHTDSYDEVEVKAGKNNSEQAVFEYTDILEQWRARIFGAADSIKSEFEEVSNAQQELIKEEGARQAAAVVDKGVEVLSTIPEDYTVTHNMAERAVRRMAGAIELESEGETIVVNDSSDLHLHGLNVYGKSSQVTTAGAQLLDYINKAVVDNSHYAVDENGAIRQLAVDSRSVDKIPMSQTLSSGTYTAGIIEVINPDNGTATLQIFDAKTGYEILKTDSLGSFVLGADTDISFKVYDTTHTCSAKVMLNAGDTLLDWEPYSGGIPAPNPSYPQEIESASPNLSIYGKNLLKPKANTVSGYTAVINDDGSVTITGSASVTSSIYFTFAEPSAQTPLKLSKDMSYVGYGHSTNGKAILTRTVDNHGNSSWSNINDWDKHVGTDYMNIVQIYVESSNHEIGDTSLCGTYYFQLEIGDTFTEFEGYKDTQTLSTSQKLHGIPVKNGGNYTDPTGQQWVCDEIDLERGVKVQRCGNYTYDGSEDENWKGVYTYAETGAPYMSTPILRGISQYQTPMLCNRGLYKSWSGNLICFINGYKDFVLGGSELSSVMIDTDTFRAYLAEHPFEIVYVLETPIEIPLTAEEIEAYKTLHSYHPSTTVFNDANAFMRVKYVADTKTYIDNKFAELASLITSQNN